MENDINESAIKLLKELIEEMHLIVFLFQSGYDNAATTEVSLTTNKLTEAIKLIDNNKLIEIDYSILNVIFINITKAIERKNNVLIYDIFEYELEPILYSWLLEILGNK